MDNKNLTLKWIDTLGNNKIVFERGIIDGTKNRDQLWILVRVILKLLKYEGNYIDYGTIGYPEKNINCPSGSEVGETP